MPEVSTVREGSWKRLFARALSILDTAVSAGMPAEDWSFGGGTVLMLKHRHRFSKDIDIFVPDPQHLGFLSPRLNDTAELEMTDYIEQHGSIKIYYPEGEVDFVAAASLTEEPFAWKELFDRSIKIEQPAEIVGKKIQYRALDFKARDIFDLALVLEREPDARPTLQKLMKQKRDELEQRFVQRDTELREDFALLDVLEYTPTYEYCVEIILANMQG